MSDTARVVRVDDLEDGGTVQFTGAEHGAGVSFFISRTPPGRGPGLHRHPYEETFIVEAGRIRFTVGDDVIEAGPGDIVVAPAAVPHAFVVVGDEPIRSINIHPVETMETEWLE
jgi:quercetin dioxygenase-like cupin family protein